MSENVPIFSLFIYISVTNLYEMPIMCQTPFWEAHM